MSNLERMS